MPKYSFITTTTITMFTEVDAESLAQAISEAKSRCVQDLCYNCSKGDSSQEWVTSGELDGDPAYGKLSELVIDEEVVPDNSLAEISKMWSRNIHV